MPNTWLTTKLALSIWGSFYGAGNGAIPNAAPNPTDYLMEYQIVRSALNMYCTRVDFVDFWDCARPIVLYRKRGDDLHYLTLAKEGAFIQALVVGKEITNEEAWKRWKFIDSIN